MKLVPNPMSWISNPKGYVSSFVSWDIQFDPDEDLPSNEALSQVFNVVFGDTDLVQTDFGSLKRTLALIAIKLQAKNTEELFNWMLNENKIHRSEDFMYPSLDDHLAKVVGPMALNFFTRLRLEIPEAGTEVSKEAREKINRLVSAFLGRAASVAPFDDTQRLLIKARERGLSVRRHSNRPSFQIGIGAKQAVVSNGFTNFTSQIATNISTHKPLAAAVLSNAGLPVPRHLVVRSLADAVRAADQIGFPVVVKPTSADKGVGVFIAVDSKEELALAFEGASKYGSVLVEKYLKGFDHRFHVLNGKCLYVTQRVPPFVEGNGVDTIEALFEESKVERAKNPVYLVYPSASLTDPEVARQLNKRGYTAATILSQGEAFHLRLNANVSTGGSYELITSRVHPDNIALAERAARIVGLDNAGVDFITTDVSINWQASGGGICEINANPGTADYTSFDRQLEHFFPDPSNGRVPLVLVVSSLEGDNSLLLEIEKLFVAHGLTWGAIQDKTLKVVAEFSSYVGNKSSLRESIHGLVSDSAVAAAYVAVAFADLAEGLEIDYFSLILTSGLSEGELEELQSFAASRCNQNQIIENPSREVLIPRVQGLLSDLKSSQKTS